MAVFEICRYILPAVAVIFSPSTCKTHTLTTRCGYKIYIFCVNFLRPRQSNIFAHFVPVYFAVARIASRASDIRSHTHRRFFFCQPARPVYSAFSIRMSVVNHTHTHTYISCFTEAGLSRISEHAVANVWLRGSGWRWLRFAVVGRDANGAGDDRRQ